MNTPYLMTDNKQIDQAYRLAVATLTANIYPFQSGLLEQEEPVIIAGLGYVKPWTRDASINVWNAAGLICPDVAKNTLTSVVSKTDGENRIDGQYWDKIIWTIGAWWQYLYTGDKEFLAFSYGTVCKTLEYLEQTEFSKEWNLFRGPACYGDGVGAYPDIYAQHGQSGILAFSQECKELCVNSGVGIPMFALSTNCLYYYAYILADKMAAELRMEPIFEDKARKMKNAINDTFWDDRRKTYRYLHDEFGGCDSAEGMGLSFAILFGVAEEAQKQAIFEKTYVSAYGIPCLYPDYSRYAAHGVGRHSGCVWPHIQGFWADAAASNKRIDIFDFELQKQAENALRYHQYAELYHPATGELYGGLQEDAGQGIRLWPSQPVQTWSATAYLRNVYFDLLGMRFAPEGIAFQPVGSALTKKITLKSLAYRNAVLDIHIEGSGSTIGSFLLNGVETKPFIPSDLSGNITITIKLI